AGHGLLEGPVGGGRLHHARSAAGRAQRPVDHPYQRQRQPHRRTARPAPVRVRLGRQAARRHLRTAVGQLTVEKAEDGAGVRAFVDYPYAKYKGDPNWVAPLRISQFEMLDEKKNPFWRHAEKALYLAKRDGRVVGRVAYVRDDAHIRVHDEQLAFFGFFEAEDEEAAKALLQVVESHASAEGLTAVRGPINPSMNDGAGFQVDAFDAKPAVMMPQNPAEYPRWVEGAGYSKIKDLYCFEFDTHKPFDERIDRIAERTKSRYPIVVRPADMKRFDREIEILKKIHTEA